jgi:hypothetical protein
VAVAALSALASPAAVRYGPAKAQVVSSPSATAIATAVPFPTAGRAAPAAPATPGGRQPTVVFGKVTMFAMQAPAGVPVVAYQDFIICGSGVFDGTNYSLNLDPSIWACWYPGHSIHFTVNGQGANETASTPAIEGGVIHLNLTVGTVLTPVPQPQSTPATAPPLPVPPQVLPPQPTPAPAGVAGPIHVAASLDTDTCTGGPVTVTATVTDANGSPVPGIGAMGFVQYATSARSFSFPPTDANGTTSVVVDTGDQGGGYNMLWTVTATAGDSTDMATTTCFVP